MGQEEFFKYLGLQQTPPQALAGTAMAAPTISPQELLFRSFASAMPPPGTLRYRTPGQAVGMGALRLLQGFTGTMADELARQRLDPLQRQLAIGQQLEQMGTKPLAPPTLAPDTTFSVLPEGQQAVPSAPLTPGIGQAGQPTFSPENLPTAARIAFAPLIAPLQQYEATKQQIAASKAQIAAEQARLPLIEAQTLETRAQTSQREQDIEEKKRQDKADTEFRNRAAAFRQANPAATPQQYTDFLIKNQLDLGASDKASKPVLEALGASETIRYHNALIAAQQQEQARLSAQFKQTMERGDVDSARQVVNAQLLSHDRTIKELESRISGNQKIAQDPAIKPEEKKLVAEQIRTDRQMIETERTAKKDAEKRLEGLFAESKSGKAVLSKIPEPPKEQQPGTINLEGDFLDILPKGYPVKMGGGRQSTPPTRPASQTGGFQASYEGRARQAAEGRVEVRAKELAKQDGFGVLIPTAAMEEYRRRARQELGL